MEVSQRFFAMWPGYGTLSIMNWTVLPPNSCVEILAFSTSRAAVLCLVAQSSPTLCDPMDCSSPGSSVHWDSPGKNTGVGCHAIFQGIFLTQVSCIAGRFFTIWITREALRKLSTDFIMCSTGFTLCWKLLTKIYKKEELTILKKENSKN